MKLRFTRAGGPARKMILAGLISGLAVAGVATATIAGASTHHQQRYRTAATAPMAWKYSALDAPVDRTFTQLLGINDQGSIAGYYGSGADARHPNKGFVVNRPYTHGRDFRWQNFPGSVQTQVVAVNAKGMTAGFYVRHDGANVGFVRWNNHWISVAYPRTPRKNAFNQLLGINDNGIATGFYNDAKGNSHGYLYNVRTRQFFLLRLPVRTTSIIVTGINNQNVIVGFFVTGRTTVAFVIKNGVFHQLSFGGKTNTQALGVNATGSVVGSFVDTAGKMHGFLWTSTGLHQIDSPWGKGGTLINGLNNNGILVGFFIDANGNTRGFIVRATNTWATNYWWNWKTNNANNANTLTPIPATSPSNPTVTWPSTGPSASPGAIVNGNGTMANGGVNAQDGNHW
jgi:probable HAF family extracellular repeat protein